MNPTRSNTPDKILHVDYVDQIHVGYLQKEVYGEARIRRLVQLAAEAGVTTLYWRVEAWGRVSYRSKVRTIPPVVGQLGYELLSFILETCDPLEIAIDECRRHGLRIYPYITLFDECYDGVPSDFVRAHPHVAWKHRTLNHHNPGLISYAYPEVQEHRLAQIRELLEYGADGLYIDVARSHAGSNPVYKMPLETDPFLMYGFNEPEAQEYQRRHGADPRKQPYDDEAWNRIRGEFLTQFLRAATALVHEHHQQVCVGFYTDDACYLSPAGQRGRIVMGRLHHDWETWVSEDLIDEIILFAEHRRVGFPDWDHHSRSQFQAARNSGKKVYLWVATETRFDELPTPWTPLAFKDDPTAFRQTITGVIKESLSTDADGVYLHEARDIELLDYWDAVAAGLKVGSQ